MARAYPFGCKSDVGCVGNLQWVITRDDAGYATGYRVEEPDGGDVLYETGNHPGISEVWVDPRDETALSVATLRAFAKLTTAQMAAVN